MLSSLVPNFRILSRVVAEKSLTEKSLQTDKQTQLQKKQKLYTPYILRNGGIRTILFIFASLKVLYNTIFLANTTEVEKKIFRK